MNAEIQGLLTEAWQAALSGQAAAAEQLCRRAFEQDPNCAEAMVVLGALADMTGRPDTAMEHVQHALQIEPTSFSGLTWLVRLLLTSDNPASATLHAEKNAILHPKSAEALEALSRCYLQEGRLAEALGCVDAAISMRPDQPEFHYTRAVTLFRLENYFEAAEAIRRCLHALPTEDGAVLLAAIELKLGRFARALQAATRALKRNPQSSSAHVSAATALTNLDRIEEAEAHWKTALEEAPDPEAILIVKALALLRQGEFESATRALEDSIKAQPRQGDAYCALTSSKRITETDCPLIDQMEAVRVEGGLAPDQEMNLAFALGKAYDNLGDYPTANQHFERANELLRASIPPAITGVSIQSAVVDANIAAFTKKFLSEIQTLNSRSDVPIFVVGMMRSGTSLVEQVLTCHPEIGGAGEQSFWQANEHRLVDFQRKSLDMRTLRRASDEYLELLANFAPGYARIVDKNPANVFSLGLIHRAFPNARIIHTRRQPIDTAMSIWMTPMKTSANFVGDRAGIVATYKEYLRIMGHWREVIPSDRLLEVDYEDLIANPETVVREMLEFCGLPWNEACLHPELNDRKVLTPSFWQVRQPFYISSIDRWRRYEPWLGEFRDLLALPPQLKVGR